MNRLSAGTTPCCGRLPPIAMIPWDCKYCLVGDARLTAKPGWQPKSTLERCQADASWQLGLGEVHVAWLVFSDHD